MKKIWKIFMERLLIPCAVLIISLSVWIWLQDVWVAPSPPLNTASVSNSSEGSGQERWPRFANSVPGRAISPPGETAASAKGAETMPTEISTSVSEMPEDISMEDIYISDGSPSRKKKLLQREISARPMIGVKQQQQADSTPSQWTDYVREGNRTEEQWAENVGQDYKTGQWEENVSEDNEEMTEFSPPPPPQAADDFTKSTPRGKKLETMLAQEERLRREIERLSKRIESGESDRDYNLWIKHKDPRYVIHDSQRLKNYEEQLEKLVWDRTNL